MFADSRPDVGSSGPAPVVEQWIRTPESKIRPPVAQLAVVPRNRLLDQLASARFQIVAIEAPGGFGKSTLAAQFAEQSVVSAWATLDHTDSDPLVLVATVLSALDHAGVLPDEAPRDWTDQVSSDEPSFSRFLVPQFRRIIESSSPATLVLDQVEQVIGSQAGSLLTALVDSLPSGSAVTLLGRSLRSLPLALWRGQGRLCTITATDLLFDETEIAQALRGFQGRTPDPGYVGEVAQHTEGWPVAVYLGAISERYPVVRAADLHEYVDAEILAGVDPDVTDFLRRTSPLEVLSPSACSAVLGDHADVAELLGRAEASSLLVRRIQDESRSFRVHALLREHLLGQLADQDPAGLRRTHARASAWCSEQHLTPQAITHARLSGDADLLGRTLWPAVADALLFGQGGRARRWLDPTDEETLARSPALSLTAAWTAVSFTEPASAQRWAAVTRRLLGPDWEDRPWTSTVEPGFAVLLAIGGAEDWAHAVRLCAAAENALPPDSLLRIFATYIHGAFTVFAGDVDAGVALLEQGRQLATSRMLWTAWSESAALLAIAYVHLGELERAQVLARQARDTWERHDREGGRSTTALLATASATVACLSGGRPVRDHLEVALTLLPEVAPILPWIGAIMHATAARCTVRTDERAAVEHLRQARTMLTAVPPSLFLTKCVVSAEQAVAHEQRIAVLSPAERRVWRLLLTRMTIREIADRLFLSPETVKSHTAAIYRKLDVATRREAQELGDTLAHDTAD